MFSSNSFDNPDALWQHALMIVIASAIGYVIGHISVRQKERRLDSKLAKLNSEIENCQEKKAISNPPKTGNLTQPLELNAVSAPRSDNFKIIDGIDRNIQILLNSEGIYTFQQLSSVSSERIMEILQNSDVQFQAHQPRTWPQQAELAANERWEDLKELQTELNKAR